MRKLEALRQHVAWQWNSSKKKVCVSSFLFPKVCSHLPMNFSLFSHSVTPWLAYRCSVSQHPALTGALCLSILLLQVFWVSVSCSYRSSGCQHPALSSFPNSCVAIPAPASPDLLAKKWHSSESVVCHQKLQLITSKLPVHIQIGFILPHIHLFDPSSLLMSTRLLKWILSRKCLSASLLCMSCSCSSALIFHPIYIIFIVHYLHLDYINNLRKRSYNKYYSLYYKCSQVNLQKITSQYELMFFSEWRHAH